MATTMRTIGLQIILESFGFDSSNYRIKLFTNTFIPNENSVLGNFTEADFPGYDNNSFVGQVAFPQIDGNSVYYDQDTYFLTNTATATGNTIYGWYVTDNLNTEVYMFEKFATAVDMNVLGNTINITPRIYLGGV